MATVCVQVYVYVRGCVWVCVCVCLCVCEGMYCMFSISVLVAYIFILECKKVF